MNLPSTKTVLSNGALGRIGATEDGDSALVLSGVAVSGKFALGDILGPFQQLADVEAAGIDSEYDSDNSTIAWKHCKDFFEEVNAQGAQGTNLYIIVVAMTQTLTSTCTEATTNSVKKLIEQTNGKVKLVGLTFTPDGSYTPSYSGQYEADLWTALAALKTTWDTQFGYKRPFRAIVEGRNFQGTVGSAKNIRDAATSPNVNMAMVVTGNDYEYGAGSGYKSKYAAVGAALGRAAAVKVNRNIGRVKNGPTKIVTAGLSNGAKLSTFSIGNQNTLNAAGYVFLREHIGKSGYYWNDDHMAAPVTDDYANLSLARPVDKAVRIVHRINTEEILDEISIDAATGKMDPATAKHYQAILENAINSEMSGEISSASVYIDPAQNIVSTSKLSEKLTIVPTATGREIETTIEYSNPQNA